MDRTYNHLVLKRRSSRRERDKRRSFGDTALARWTVTAQVTWPIDEPEVERPCSDDKFFLSMCGQEGSLSADARENVTHL